jgi:hypothetical protein
MNRHQRRKASRRRKDVKADRLNARAMLVLKEERLKRNLATPMPKRSPKGLGNPAVWRSGLYLPGFGTGAFKEKPLGERTLRELRAKSR